MTAWHHWSAMHAWWCARRDEREPIGKPWAPKGSPRKSVPPAKAPATGTEQEAGVVECDPAPAEIAAAPVSDPFDGLVAPSPHDDTRCALVARVNALAGEHADKLKAAGVALQLRLSQPGTWPVERFDEIALALREIELAVGPDPFAEENDPPKFGDFAKYSIPRVVPGTKEYFQATIVEGPPIDPDDVAALRKAFEALEPGDKAWVESLLREARTAGVPFGALGDNPTLRRFELGRACVKLCAEDADRRPFVLALITLALGEEPQPAPLGALLGSLSASEAVKFARVVDAFVDGKLVASFSDEGVLAFGWGRS